VASGKWAAATRRSIAPCNDAGLMLHCSLSVSTSCLPPNHETYDCPQPASPTTAPVSGSMKVLAQAPSSAMWVRTTRKPTTAAAQAGKSD